jgi:hypothetical protein
MAVVGTGGVASKRRAIAGARSGQRPFAKRYSQEAFVA